MTKHAPPPWCLALAAALALAPAAGCGFRKAPKEACYVYVVTSDSHTCARKADGKLFCWGNNQYGQLAIDSGGAPVGAPTEVTSLGGGIASIYVPAPLGLLSSRTATTCARRTDGALLCWGNNQNGQLGVGDTSERASPVLVAPEILGTGRHNVTGGAGFFCDRRPSDNSLWCWGNNEFGQLGDGTTLQRTLPVAVATLGAEVSSASAGGNHTCALKIDGTLWCWGQNRSGQLGTGDTQARHTPAEVAALGAGIVAVFTGAEHTCAVKAEEDGQSLHCWGLNAQGQLGLGDTRNRLSPARVDFTELGAGVSMVSAGAAHTCAAKSDGSLYCWGENRYGQLGLNTEARERVTTPTQVFAEVMSSGVAVVYAGGAHTCARTNDNALWCWGQNQHGQLGRVTQGDALQPYRVAPLCN